jgi:hypothetical protein
MTDKPRIQIDNTPILGLSYLDQYPEYTHLLFTDFDGVLHGFSGGVLLTKVKQYEQILRDNPHVGVVFSTSWRFSQTFYKLLSYFSKDLHERFIGTNPYCQEKWPPYIKYERYKECIKFMEVNNWTGPWTAIDDADDLFIPDCVNLILCDGQVGLDEATEQQLRERLKVSC